MKMSYAIALSLLAGTAVGALAVKTLHAQAKVPAYYVAEVDVTDRDGYLKEFVPKAQAFLRASGGKFIAQGGKTTSLMGEPPKSRVVIQQWDSIDQLMQWFNSSEQKSLREIQAKYAKVRAFAVEGVQQ
jgi:uncharacterized protein (DUF1330 family)